VDLSGARCAHAPSGKIHLRSTLQTRPTNAAHLLACEEEENLEKRSETQSCERLFIEVENSAQHLFLESIKGELERAVCQPVEEANCRRQTGGQNSEFRV